MSDFDDFTMAYQDSADGLTLLMIHGFPLNSSMWELQMEDLATMARLIAPDLRGHGFSDPAAGPYSMEMLAKDCAGLLDRLAIETPVIVCGHSMGGYVAFEFCRRYPERVAGLILVGTRPGADSAEGKAGREKTAESVRTEGPQVVVKTMLPKLFAPATYESDQEVVEFVEDMMTHTSANGMIGALLAMRDRPDSTPDLADLDIPVLIIHGADDKLIPPSEAHAMHEAFPDSQLVIIPGAGHLPNLERPDEFNDAVVDFLESLADEEE